MPSFFEGLKRLINGQPVFQEGDRPGGGNPAHQAGQADEPHGGQATQTAPEQEHHATPRDSHGRKVIPAVRVSRVMHYDKGNGRVEYWCAFHNDSPQQIEVERIVLFGRTHEVQIVLGPHGERQARVYAGPALTTDHYREAEIQYKDHDGDWFASTHDVLYDLQSDGKTHIMTEMRLRPPLRDIYE